MTLKKIRGLSLLEILIVIAIISILASVAYPSYTKYVLKAKRADAISGLTQIQSQLEQFYAINNFYPSTIQVMPMASYYTFTITAGSTKDPKTSYLITATTTGTQTDDTDCQSFTLDNTNAQQAYKTDGKPNPACWGR